MTYIYHDGAEEDPSLASGFEKLLEELQEGDCMVVERLSGAAKDGASLLKLLDNLEARGIRFRSVEEKFDTGSEEGRFAVEILRKVAQLDARSQKEQSDPGTREDNHSKGRKPIEVDEELFDSILERWKNGEITARQAMSELNLKPNTFYRRVKERRPDAKSTDALLDAAKKFGQEIVNTVTEGSEEFQQAAGKFAAEHDMGNISDTVKKNISAAGKVLGRHIDSLSKDFQEAVEKYEKKQQETTKAAEGPVPPVEPEEHAPVEEPIPAETPVTEETAAGDEKAQAPEAAAEEPVTKPEETEYL